MGCTQGSKKAASAPTLLTSKAANEQTGPASKVPVPNAAPLAVREPAVSATKTGQTLDVPTAAIMPGAGVAPVLNVAAADGGAARTPLTGPMGVGESARFGAAVPCDSFGSSQPRTFASRCQAMAPDERPKTPASADGSFISSHSLRTNFSFGLKPSTRSFNTVSSNNLASLPEGNVAQEAIAEEYSMDGAHDEVDGMTQLGQAVEKTVHALVDAGEGAWSQAKSAWNSQWSMYRIEEEDGEDAGDAEELASRKRLRNPKELSWACGAAQ